MGAASPKEPDQFCSKCGRPTVPVKQLVFEALAGGANVTQAARKAKCSRQYVQTLKKAAQDGQLSLPLAAVNR
jgi:hypothetical protein